MPIPTWLPALSSLLLGFASIAIAVPLLESIWRAPSVAPSASVRIAGGAFLLGSAVAYFGETAGLTPPLLELLGTLRALTALTGFVAVVLFVSAKSSKNRSAPPSKPKPSSAHRESPPSLTPPAPTSSTTLLDAPPPEPGFLGLVSHELRTPLTAMQLLLDRLDGDGDELAPRHRKIVDRLGATANRLTDLVDSILYYARIQNGRLVTSVEPFDLATIATDAAEELRPQASRKSLDLKAARASDRVSVESDPKLVRLVIVNLVSNAVKFTEQGGIDVSASAEGDRCVVRVADTGRGIAPDEQARIFEPFQQVELTKHKHQPGIGLGLSLARRIVEGLGGRITVRSEVGKGSTFELSLPAVAIGPHA